MDTAQRKRIEHLLNYIDLEPLSDAQELLILSFAEQFARRRRLSERQVEILEDIFRRQNES